MRERKDLKSRNHEFHLKNIKELKYRAKRCFSFYQYHRKIKIKWSVCKTWIDFFFFKWPPNRVGFVFRHFNRFFYIIPYHVDFFGLIQIFEYFSVFFFFFIGIRGVFNKYRYYLNCVPKHGRLAWIPEVLVSVKFLNFLTSFWCNRCFL